MSRSTARLALVLLLLAQAGVTAYFYLQRRGALVDDAYISFRYAARWAEGQGLTWNDGEAVEGFSNPLWTLGLGLLARAGIPPHVAAPIWGFLAALGATGLTLVAGRRRGLSAPILAALGAGLALDVGLAVWSGSGLETALAAFLVALFLLVAAARRDLRGGFLLGIVASGLVLARPEGAAWVGWGLVWLIWGTWAPGRMLVGFVVGLVPAAGYEAFRIAVFGRALPNPFFAKLEPSGLGLDDGLAALGIWALAHAVWSALLLDGAVRARKQREETDPGGGPPRWNMLPAGLLLLQGGFVIVAGGDWMGRARYLVPVLPALYLLAALALRERRAGAVPARLTVGAALAVQVVLGWVLRDTIPTYTREGRRLGEWLAGVADSSDTIAVTAAGAIPYFSGLPAVDILGINDPDVARRPPRHTGAWAPGHHRYDLEQLLDRAPTWIVWDFGVRLNGHRWRTYEHWAEGERGKLDYRQELFAHPRFTERYEVDMSAPRETQGVYTVYRKKDRRPERAGGP